MALHKDSSPYCTGPITLTIVRGDSESQPSRTTLSRSHVRMTGRCRDCFTAIAPPQSKELSGEKGMSLSLHWLASKYCIYSFIMTDRMVIFHCSQFLHQHASHKET
jgi:hypothetical protein